MPVGESADSYTGIARHLSQQGSATGFQRRCNAEAGAGWTATGSRCIRQIPVS